MRQGDFPEPGRQWTEAELELLWADPAYLGLVLGKDWLVSLAGDIHPKYDGLPVPKALHSKWILDVWLGNHPLMAHRGSLKTTDISEVGTIWNWSLEPLGRRDDRIMLVRGNFTAASSSMATIARNMKNPKVVSLFETLYGEGSTATEYARENEILYKFKRTNTKEGSITAWGILQDFTGFHCDRVLGDDFITRESQYSAAVRQKTIAAVNEIQTNIVDKGGTCHWIGTPWHKDDAWNCIQDPIKYAHRPWKTDTGEEIQGTFLMSDAEYEAAIWGTRKDGKRYRKISVSQEAANYKLDPSVVDEGLMFANLADMAPWNPGIRASPVYAHLDAAYDGDDWTALTMGQRLPDGRIQVTGYAWPEHVSLCTEAIVKACKDRRVSMLTAERNADKGYSLRDLIATFKASKLPIQVPKDAKGLPGYQESENKHVKITTELLGQWGSLVWDSEIQDECISMVTNYSATADHDDSPDSFASLLREFFPKEGQKKAGGLSFFLPKAP